MINPIKPLQSLLGAVASGGVAAKGTSSGTPFARVFAEQLQSQNQGHVRFSAHATQRLQDRNLQLTANDKARIAGAVDEAASKGSRETLVLMDQMALVVSVPNRTVITVAPTSELKNTVFTNIDSAVVVPEGSDASR